MNENNEEDKRPWLIIVLEEGRDQKLVKFQEFEDAEEFFELTVMRLKDKYQEEEMVKTNINDTMMYLSESASVIF